MKQTRIKLHNGQILSSGSSGDAVVSLGLTRAVNSGGELTLGSVCAAMAEIELIVQTESPIGQNDRFTLYRGEECIGIFTAEKPQWLSDHRVKITAYDAIAQTDRDVSIWLKEKTDWPCTLQELANGVCEACGLQLEQTELPNGDFPVEAFSGQGITGRKILSWIGQATGRFCYALPDGKITFGWYTPSPMRIGPTDGRAITATLMEQELVLSGVQASFAEDTLCLEGPLDVACEDGNLTLGGEDCQFYYQRSLQLADYQTAPVEKVQIRQDDRDVGTVWPDVGEANTYIITGNPLLAARSADHLLPIAQSLYEQLNTLSYTPCTLTVPGDADILPGQILHLSDGAGRMATVYVMETSTTGQRTTIRCTGSATRDSISLRNNRDMELLNGKLLRLQTDVDGLRAEHIDTAGKTAALSLTVDGLESKVTIQQETMQNANQQLTVLQQNADTMELKIQSIREQGTSRVTTTTGYSFGEDGLRIQKSGLEMENLIDHTGMVVRRNGQVILSANNRGVVARDVTVDNYLIVGSHARLEDYNGGTACFYL